jgi:CHAT domain-containing protein/tetratricopeptide (TPR) repeat protein
LQSQNYYETYQSLDSNKPYTAIKTSTDSLIELASKKKRFGDIAKISKDFSLKAYRNNYDEAIYYATMSYENKELLNEIDKEYVSIIYRVGYFYFKKKDIITAITYYDKCLEINSSKLVSGQALCELGRCYFELNDYYKSINYYKKGISILEELKKYSILEREYKNISLVYDELDTKTSLISKLDILKKADSIEKNHRNSVSQRLKINNAYVTLYSRDKMYDYSKAVHFSKQNIALASKYQEPVYLCTSYVNLANLSNKIKNDSTLYYAEKSQKYCKRPIAISSTYYVISDYYNYKENYISALINNQKGLNVFLDSTNKKNFSNVPKLNELNDLNEKDYIIQLINDKSKLLHKLSQKENTTKYSKIALKHILVADSLVDNIQVEITQATQIHWRQKASEIYSIGAELCYELNKPETAFYLLEKGKALLLTEDIINNNALSKLPDSIKSRELELKKIVYKTSSKQKGNEKFEAELDYEKYLDSIKVIYPHYFKNQSLQNVITLTELQEGLDDKTIIVSYLWSNSDTVNNTVFALFVSKEETELIKVGDSEDISSLVNRYREFISRPLSYTHDRAEFNEVAYNLYDSLFKPKESKINITGKNLIIIPDGKLHNIPFEALTTNKDELNYLIKSRSISYAYSMSFLKENKKIPRTTKNDFVGFAPITFNSLKLSTLDNSLFELDNALSITNGSVYKNDKATKTAFLNNASDSKIIHLATHADASENPWIAFSDEKLNLQELYTFKNNAELTILSSCDTSIGKLAEGEGVMSLARGFFYSGSNSVVASLWNVNDKSTSFLMNDFYKNLKSGETKSEALRNAKLNYLKSHSLSEASPYYWSSFILLGDTNKIDLGTNFTLLHYFIIGIILLIIIILFLKFKKK